ncbi:hypothetical protein F383_38998 [Gossypium arboreum]|uniref:Uncharacterized protein n=1 Tax=Gossypium arboreum TaxID=29729 RepID=A0A0B0MEC4_GOSAR|nr:hypothetical protein F383_38998 [Gossypium arboreum]
MVETHDWEKVPLNFRMGYVGIRTH